MIINPYRFLPATPQWTPTALSPLIYCDPHQNVLIPPEGNMVLPNLISPNYDFVQSTLAARPTLGARNGKSILNATATQFMVSTLSSFPITDKLWIFCYVQFTARTWGRLFSYVASGDANDFAPNTSVALLINNNNTSNLCTYRANAVRSNKTSNGFSLPHMACVIYNGTNAVVHVNGVAGSVVGSTGNFGTSGLLGLNTIPPTASSTQVGWYGAFFIGTTTLTQSDIDKGFGYLAHYYSEQALLPGGHPYRNNPPTL